MTFLTIDTVKKQFSNENLHLLVEDLNALRTQAITLIKPEAYDALVSAVANEDYDATMTALLTSDDQGITVLQHLYDLDIDASGIEDATNIDNLNELAEVHVLILDNTYNDSIESTTLIPSRDFTDYIRDIEVEAGNIASHLESHFPWQKYADQAAIDYAQVEVNAPNTLGLDYADFYIRK